MIHRWKTDSRNEYQHITRCSDCMKQRCGETHETSDERLRAAGCTHVDVHGIVYGTLRNEASSALTVNS